MGLSSRIQPNLKSYNILLSKATYHAIDNILQRDLGFFSHLCLRLCLPVCSVGGGRVCDDPASTLPSLSSSHNKGIPAFQKSVLCFRFYIPRQCKERNESVFRLLTHVDIAICPDVSFTSALFHKRISNYK